MRHMPRSQRVLRAVAANRSRSDAVFLQAIERSVALAKTPSIEDIPVRAGRLQRPPTPRRHPHRDLPNRAHLHHPPRLSPLFPTCTITTADLPPPTAHPPTTGRALMMPRRKQTRAQDRAHHIAAERRLNDTDVAERNKPPPL